MSGWAFRFDYEVGWYFVGIRLGARWKYPFGMVADRLSCNSRCLGIKFG